MNTRELEHQSIVNLETSGYASLFERSLPNYLDNVAVVSDRGSISYDELNRRSTEIANRLSARGVGPEVLVGVCAERSLETVTLLLAIWKAGGAFLVLDPTYPSQRLKFMLEDSAAPFLALDPKYESLFAGAGSEMWDLFSLTEKSREHPRIVSPCRASTGDQLAYVVYTSGSTGKPKGVEIPNRALVNHNLSIARKYGLGPADRALQFASLSFDVALEEIFPSWLSGSTVVLRWERALSSTAAFIDFVAEERITVLNLPTAFWQGLIPELEKRRLPASVRLVVIGGESAAAGSYKRWLEAVGPHPRLINAYGPTEATITATLHEPGLARNALPIGRPIDNTYTVVLNGRLEPVPEGTAGELFLGGLGLARGYRHRPELTAQRFIENPHRGDVPSERLYRTGDLVQVNPDGELEFLGRVDDQVKIRGFRIEPAEIAAVLLEHPALNQACVIAQQEPEASKHLVAYYVVRTGYRVTSAELRRFLKGRLPGYMIPGYWIELQALPLTPAGKVDREALPRHKIEGTSELNSPVPKTLEEQIASIWRTVLKVPTIGVTDNFFELGGDSLLALQILGRIRQELGVELPLGSLFDGQTIAAMSEMTQSLRGANERCGIESTTMSTPVSAAASVLDGSRSPLVPACQQFEEAPVSFVQERLWFLNQLFPESDAYNMASAYRITGALDSHALEQALNQILRRHAILRTTFRYDGEKLVQVIAPKLTLPLELTSLESTPSRSREAVLMQRLSAAAARPFDLAKGPLLRASLLRLRPNDHTLLVVMHHIISDGWSLGIFFGELEKLYLSFAGKAPAPLLPEVQLSYADYARWQSSSIGNGVLEDHLAFWRQTLAGAPPAISWPTAAKPGKVSGTSMARKCIFIPDKTVATATRLARQQKTTPFCILLSALGITLHHWTAQREMVIGTVVAGRSRPEFENLLGCFMNFLPLRISMNADTARQLLRSVRQTLLEAQAHQDCPFDKIVAALNPQRDGNRNPLYNIALLWQNFPADAQFRPPRLKTTLIGIERGSALLDLRFEAEPKAEGWSVACEYATALFDERTIDRVLCSFRSNLQLLVQAPQTLLEEFRESGARQKRSRFWSAWLSRRTALPEAA